MPQCSYSPGSCVVYHCEYRPGVSGLSQRDEACAAAQRGDFSGHGSCAVRSLVSTQSVHAFVRLSVTQDLHTRPDVGNLLRARRPQVRFAQAPFDLLSFCCYAFSALTLRLVGRQEEHPA